MDNMQAKTKMSKGKIALILLVALVVIIVASTSAVLARFVTNNKSGDIVITAESFTFVASKLENTSSLPYPVADTISLSVYNFDALNQTALDTTYTVSVSGADSDDLTITINGVEGTQSTLTGGANSTDNIVIEGLTSGIYVVTLQSTAPYAQTIVLYYETNTVYASHYSVTTHATWVELDLYTGSSDGDITVTFGGCSPDSLNELMSSWEVGQAGTLSGLSKNAHYTLIFFIDEGSTPSFVLTQDGSTVSQD